MSSKQEGGRKISGEEKNLANKQAELFGLQTDQMKALQAVLQNLQPQQYQLLGFDPSTGMPLQQGQLPTAPTAVGDPGAAPDKNSSKYQPSGKKISQKDWDKANALYQSDLNAWNQRNTQYQQYQQQLASYNQLAQQAQQHPEQVYMPDVAGQRAQESSLLDKILSGQMTPEQAASQGQIGGVAAGRAGLMSEFLRWINNNPNAQAAQGALSGYQNELNTGGVEAPALQQLLGLYQNELSTGGAEAPALQQLLGNYQNLINGDNPNSAAMQQLMGNYQNQLAGNIPEASQLADLLSAITRGVNGTGAVNPMVQRQLDQQEQDRRTRLFQQLGAGYETSSAGIEALNTLASTRAGTIDQLNQIDLMNSLQGYMGLLSGAQNRQANTANQYLGFSGDLQNQQAQTANQYLGLSGNQQQRQAGYANQYQGLSATQQNRQAQLLNQYLGLNEDTRLNTNAALQGYTGLTNFSEGQRVAEYQNELARRTGIAGLQAGIATAPYTGVDYTNLINSYTGALGAATQRQTGPVSQGGIGGAIGGLAGTALGGGLGYLAGGPVGAMYGAQLGGGLGGSAGGAMGGGGYQPPPLYNMGGMGGGGGSANSFNLGSFYTRPYYG